MKRWIGWMAAMLMGLSGVAQASALPPLATLPPQSQSVQPAATQPPPSSWPAIGESPQTADSGAASIGQYRGTLLVDVSSYYVNKDKSILVDGHCAADEKLNTAWNSNRKGAGEYVQLAVSDGQRYQIAGFRIANGYWKDSGVYARNARLHTVDVYCDGQYMQTFQCEDVKDYQTFWFSSPVTAATVRFSIIDTYRGTQFQDCAVTEIELIGAGARQLTSATLADWGAAVRQAQALVTSGGSLQSGDKSMAVLGLQLLLREGFGTLAGVADGDFGGQTREAVRMLAQRMQEAASANPSLNLAPMRDGIVDQAYWNNMLAYMDAM